MKLVIVKSFRKISISMVGNNISYENLCSNTPLFIVSQICMISLTTILLNFEYFVSQIHSQFIMYSLENFRRNDVEKIFSSTDKYVHVDIRRLHLTLKFEWYQTLCWMAYWLFNLDNTLLYQIYRNGSPLSFAYFSIRNLTIEASTFGRNIYHICISHDILCSSFWYHFILLVKKQLLYLHLYLRRWN